MVMMVMMVVVLVPSLTYAPLTFKLSLNVNPLNTFSWPAGEMLRDRLKEKEGSFTCWLQCLAWQPSAACELLHCLGSGRFPHPHPAPQVVW